MVIRGIGGAPPQVEPDVGALDFCWEPTTLDGKPCRVVGAGAGAARRERDARAAGVEQRARRAAAFRLGKAFATPEGRAALLKTAGLTPGAGATQVGFVGDEAPTPDIDPNPNTRLPGSTQRIGPPLPTTRYRYAWYDAAPTPTGAPGPTLAQTPVGTHTDHQAFDPCDPSWNQTRTEFDVCLRDDFTFASAVELLDVKFPTGWQSELWASIDACFDPGTRRLSDDEFARLLPQSAADGSEMWSARWDPSPAGMNYTSSSDAPRQVVLRAALDLMVCLSTGIPEKIATDEDDTDRADERNLRKHVVDPIREGWMSYHMYREGGSGAVAADIVLAFAALTPAALAETLNLLQYGVANRWGVSSALTGAMYALLVDIESFVVHEWFEAANDTDATHWTVLSTPQAEADPTATLTRPGSPRTTGPWVSAMPMSFPTPPVMTSDCAQATWILDLSGDVDFQFQFFQTLDGPKHSGNHGLFTPRVWVTPSGVDQAAVMYDWFVALATRHFAAANDTETRGAAERARQALAANICLRRACSAAAQLGCLLVHETSHNVSLYHCYDPVTFKPQGCYQDVAAYAWLVYVQAKLGTARTQHYGPNTSDPTTILFSPTARSVSHWTYDTNTVLGWLLKPGTQRVSETVLECSQGDSLSGAAEFGVTLLAEVLAVLVLGGLVGPELITYLSAVIAQNTRVLGESKDHRTLEFVIRHPLVAGSDVSQCCVHRNSNCLVGGGSGVVSSDCWTSGELDAAGCCDSEPGPDDYTPPGGVGGGTPFGLPGPWTPKAPEYDDSDIVVDGSAESASGA